MPKEGLFERMAQSVIDGEVDVGTDLARQSLAEEIDPLESISLGFKAGLDEVGRGFEAGDYFLPDLVLGGKVMQAAVEVLEGAMVDGAAARESPGKVLLATVAGDVHSIGKDLVALMLSLDGFQVVNLGHDVPTATIVERAAEEKPDIVGLSALLSTTTQVQDVIESLQEKGLRDQIKVLVGGAACSTEWAEQIGADGFAEDAAAAVKKTRQVLGID